MGELPNSHGRTLTANPFTHRIKIIIKGMKNKSGRPLFGDHEVGQKPECLTGGSILLSNGGSVQISVKE
jgi:hypothetical protein